MYLRALVDRICRDPDKAREALVREYGSLSFALEADPRDLALSLPGEANAAALLGLLRHAARYVHVEAFGPHPMLSSLTRCREYVKALYVGAFYERCAMLCLDARFRLIRCVMMASGSISEVQFYHRQIAEEALRSGAAYVVVTHNHPSGLLHFSLQDLQTTRRAAQHLSALRVTLLDHILTADSDTYSLRQSGVLPPESWGGGNERMIEKWIKS